ncbi:MAG: DNA polymerase III subunit beta [Ignavibacteriales bacterium]|nr:DNA polymerase III subunit beta [Ignavibacteriales bacterium]MCF8306288.1 DNA polymerase III subunit beta [Ignavibacteriales bacterium]MCF8316009.1 DNA polymerase III subunit beta [Ignavibacteriales bacterium]MCF8437603.1 DNA polymerase III subunit beta [Ignavibacteriales bacterium]
MKFKVNSTEFEKVLSKVIPAVPTRTPMSVLENLAIEIKDSLMTISGSDLEIVLRASLQVEADSDISILTPAKLLYDVIKNLQDTALDITISDGFKLQIKTRNGEYSVAGLDHAQYPQIPDFPKEENNPFSIAIKGTELKNILEKTVYIISKEEVRAALRGVLFDFSQDGMRFVATDGHRLVNYLKRDLAFEDAAQYVVPEKALIILTKVLEDHEVKISFSGSFVSFVLPGIELIGRLITQKYPDYAGVIPLSNEMSLQLNTRELLNTVKRLLPFTSGNLRKIKLFLESDSMQVTAEDMDIGNSAKEMLPCSYSNDPMEIGFNATLLNDLLIHSVEYNELLFKINTPNKAVIIEPVDRKENQELMLLLMPIRLNN